MPSLTNLAQFKQDIRSLAHEPDVRNERGEEFDDIPLPSADAVGNAAGQPLDQDLASLLGVADKPSSDGGISNDAAVIDDLSSADLASSDLGAQDGQQDFDLSHFADLLDNLPLDASNAPVSDSGDSAGSGDDMFGVPDGLLNGLADSLDEANAGATDFMTSDSGAALSDDAGDVASPVTGDDLADMSFDLPDFASLDSGDALDSLAPADSVLPADSVPPADSVLPADSVPPDSFDDIDMGDFSMPTMDAETADDVAIDSKDSNTPPKERKPVHPESVSGIPSSFSDGGMGISGGIDLTPDEEGFVDIPSSSEGENAVADEASLDEASAVTDDLFNADSLNGSNINDDFSVPDIPETGDELNLSIEDVPEIDTADSEITPPPQRVSDDVDSADSLASLDDFSMPDFATDSSANAETDGEVSATDMPDLAGLDDFSMDSNAAPAEETEPLAEPVSDNLDDFSMDAFGKADADIGSVSSDISGFDTGTPLDAPTPEEEAAFMADASTPADINDIAAGFNSGDEDSFGQFSLDSNFVNESFNFSENGLNDLDSNDFSFDNIPGLDDAFSAGKAAPKKAAKAASTTFSISEKDFDTFMNVLTSYPLNLRIALEDLIVNAVVPENQIQDIVNRVINGVQPKVIATDVSDLIGKTIEIPKDFEKRSAENREEELNSFGYILRYKLLPAMAVGFIALILLGCVSFLSYEFIYRPLRASSYYKEGYACIEDSRYTESVSLFNKALGYKERKDWHYRYADAYAEHKQYQLAENIYERMLFRYPKDKKPALKYARMECEQLRNFVKAENIVRRSVLDNFVNDKDGLLLLGDIFMEWGTEDYSKYEQGGEIYNMLIETYGTKDVYLSRKLRYNIRTDNLAEVLPLKDHFMQKKHVLEPNDQVELGGYLLEKRYQPEGGDDDYLRILIEDVRECLNRGIEVGPTIPEAYYNMGKYFIHTGDKGAKNMFIRAVELFDTTDAMSPARVVRNVDACRLLGETYVTAKESIAAAEVYGKGLAVYKNAVENRTIKPNAIGGELYADIADIDYFLTGKLDDARYNYELATQNFYDTPEVRYKLGFIDYNNGNYEQALNSLVRTAAALPDDENTMFAMANALFQRKNYAAAQGYYTRLMGTLDTKKARLGILFPQVRADHGEFVQQYLETANNLAVTLYKIGQRTGDAYKQGESGVLLTEALRAYDALTRNPETLVRLSGGNLPELNIKYTRYPVAAFEPGIYANIPQLPDHAQPFKK